MLRSARSARSARIIDDRFTTLRAMGFALAGAALIASATACGDVEMKEVGEVSTPSTTPATVTGSSDSAGGNAVPEKVAVPVVSLGEAELAFGQHRYDEATKLFSAYVEQRPNNPWGHYMLGLSAWKAGDLTRAESAFVRSLELDPKHVKSLLNLSRVYLDQNRPKDARDRVEAALVLDSTSADAYRLMGRVRAALNQPNEAIAAYQVALSRNPKDAWSMNNMGLLMIQQGDYEGALGPLSLAVRLDSTVAAFHNNLGVALERTGRYVLATQAYEHALAVDAGYTKAKLSLGRVQGRTDDPLATPVELATLADAFDREIRGVQMGGPVQPPEVPEIPEL